MGSIPAGGTTLVRAISSVGRAALLHSEGRGFKSLIAHHITKRDTHVSLFV